MKHILKTIVLIFVVFCSQSMWAIDYPTYRGSSATQESNKNQVIVPLRNSPLPKPATGYYRSGQTVPESNYQSEGLGSLESSKTLNTYGSGGSVSGTVGGNRASSASVTYSGSPASVGAMPRVKSPSEGSTFGSVEHPVLAKDDEHILLREGIGPPPPGPDNPPTPENQLPLTDGMAFMLILSCLLGVRKALN